MRYLYHETTEEEKQEISKALICDAQLLAQYKELLALKRQLDEARLEPSAESVERILSYSRGLAAKVKR
jgi:hypothetical protein